MDGIGDLSPVQFGAVIALTVTLSGLVLNILKIIFTVIEARLPDRMTPQVNHGDGKVQSLQENHQDLREQVRGGFASMEAKMDTNHKDFHRRISEFKEEFHRNQVEMVKSYATKTDLRDMEKRLRLNGARP